MQHFLNRIREKALDDSQPPVLIVALGDSVTQGCMENSRMDFEGVYHRQVQQRLENLFPMTTFSTLNAGVAGNSAPNGLARLERDVIRHQPDLVLIGFGLNDSVSGPDGLPTFEAALNKILEEIRSKTQADALLITPPFMATKRTPKIHPDHECYVDGIIRAQVDGFIDRYAQVVRNVAKQTNTALADVHREWQRLRDTGMDTNLWLANGLNHPTKEGHTMAAELIFAEILRHHLQNRNA